MVIDVDTLIGRRSDDRWNRCSVGDILERTALVTPDREAIIGRPGAFAYEEFARLTYAQADQAANRFANALAGGGVEQGDRVLLMCGNSVEAVIALLGIAKSGAVAVPLNPHQSVAVITHALTLCEPTFSVCDGESVTKLLEAGHAPDVVLPIGDAVGTEVQGTDFRDFISGASTTPPELTIHGDDVWQILMTSGTTAMPKGVMISHTYAHMGGMSWAFPWSRGMSDESDLALVCLMPVVFHVSLHCFVLAPLLVRGRVILGRAYTPEGVVEAVADEKATALIAGSVQMVEAIVGIAEAMGESEDRSPLASLRTVCYGLGRLTRSLGERLDRLSPGLVRFATAGQTETVVAHRIYPQRDSGKYDELPQQLNIIGKPHPLLGSRIQPLDDPSRAAHPQEIGELVYRSPVMMSGYFRDEASTRAAVGDGWFHSGDLGFADSDGDRYLAGRLKDIIKSGGENVSSQRVEQVLLTHPLVRECAVVGLPDPTWGESVVALVVPDQPIDEAEGAFTLLQHCRQDLGRHERPKRILFVADLPRDFQDKVQKHLLRERLLKENQHGGAASPS